MLTESVRSLLKGTTAYAQRCTDSEDHTVAAGLLTRSGQSIFGLNSYHFLGGPCGEISALANHAAVCPDDPVEAVVAVFGPTGQVISPCGKCRQVLYDVDPSIQCVVRGSNGLEAVTVAELLPFAFDPREIDARQKIFMWEGYEKAIRSGAKQQTIRIDDPFQTGPALLVFEKENGEIVSLSAQVKSVVPMRRMDLTEAHARNDGFSSLVELHEALDKHYPGLRDDDLADVVTFELEADDHSSSNSPARASECK